MRLCSRVSRDSLHESIAHAADRVARFAWLTKLSIAILIICLLSWPSADGSTMFRALVALAALLIALTMAIEFESTSTRPINVDVALTVSQFIQTLRMWL
jgi:hypothetical protein